VSVDGGSCAPPFAVSGPEVVGCSLPRGLFYPAHVETRPGPGIVGAEVGFKAYQGTIKVAPIFRIGSQGFPVYSLARSPVHA